MRILSVRQAGMPVPPHPPKAAGGAANPPTTTAHEVAVKAGNPTMVPLIYMGLLYPGYAVSRTDLFHLRLGRKMTTHEHPDGRGRWNPKNPKTGKYTPVLPYRAIAESFDPKAFGAGIVAAHGPNTAPGDRVLGTCTPKTRQGNRADRERDGTHSTGHNTVRGKLAGRHQDVLAYFHQCQNVSMTARRFAAKNNSIRKLLKKYGRTAI